jgi:3-phenylpropionate/trans-cinnamate dioxygenase ferredoxin reductase subunit
MSRETFVIVGANLAGGRAAEALRKSGFEGRIVLIGKEPERPYDRPPLSKKFARGLLDEAKLYFRPLDYYETHRIELELGVTATGLDLATREVIVDHGRRIAFDKLLIATGANVRTLRVKGAELAGIYTLRTLDDAKRICVEVKSKKRVVVVGAGVIGAEIAASCREEGLEVTLIEAAELPLMRAFGKSVGAIYAEIHRAHGVDLRCGVGVTEFIGDARIEGVVLSTGERLACDFAIVGIGVSAATDWLQGSGVALCPKSGCVLVDHHAQTNVEGIYAAGDVTRFWSDRTGAYVQVESVDNAQLQGLTAVSNMLGRESVHAPVPFFWSDQYDLKLQCVGEVEGAERVIFRGSVEGRAFAAFHMVKDRVIGVIGVNRLKEIAASKRLISGAISVRDEDLANEAVPMSAFFASGTLSVL